jgi:DNA-binding HxlR family transcriptional regulator
VTARRFTTHGQRSTPILKRVNRNSPISANKGVSQKMLTQTLRHTERDGLFTRTVHLIVPPKVEYKLTPLGMALARHFAAYGSVQRKTSNTLRRPAANSIMERTD